jgi:glycosyltransferase involved in cell wall biosynthesis
LDIAQAVPAEKVTLYNVFRPRGDSVSISALRLLARAFLFDLVITNLTGNVFAAIFLFWKKRCVVIHHIDWRGSPPLSRRLQMLEVFVLRWLTPRSTAIVVVSRSWARQLRRLGFRDVTVIYNAYDLSKYRSDPERTARLLKEHGLEGQRLAYIGNGLKRKGCHLAAQALASQPVRLISTGVKSDIENTPNLSVLNLPFEDYLSLLGACEVAVLLSQFREGWNRTAHECVLLGVPVIGSPRGGMRELLRETRQRFASTSEQARRKFVANDYGIEPRDMASARQPQFTEEVFASSWRSLIGRLLSAKGQPPVHQH